MIIMTTEYTRLVLESTLKEQDQTLLNRVKHPYYHPPPNSTQSAQTTCPHRHGVARRHPSPAPPPLQTVPQVL